jgi:hypothetical protein
VQFLRQFKWSHLLYPQEGDITIKVLILGRVLAEDEVFKHIFDMPPVRH